ncbi:putative membrane protein [Chlamydia ibidis]|uniref:Membrane protein n=2 Tax=Chlamydia ibidis TaxID=1405396 RepID=A0ABP2XF04_9CHLA|nr:hypothetical protein [Chlamydia ibidis]EPP34412.1 putative membrane protein [Chlamydia ibidis]EQM62734.1 putative membrane protein [Chlamydia ibidis 10-1398/6]
MSCFNLPIVNHQLRPIDESCFPSSDNWKRILNNELHTMLYAYDMLPRYDVDLRARVIALSLVVVLGLVLFSSMAAALSVQGVVLSFGSIIPALLVPAVLIGGGIYILYTISRKVDVLSGSLICPFGPRKWVPLPLWHQTTRGKHRDGHIVKDCFIDLSTLDESKSGVALAYMYPSDAALRLPMAVFPILALPLLAIVKMVYNLIRFFVVPFYIIFQMITQYFSKIEVNVNERFALKDIAREMGRSLANFMRAPFYASAYMITVFYGLLDPLSGRVATSCLERDWNNDVIRSRGIWLCIPQRNYKFEGGGTRLGLGQFSHYLMGCFQPCAAFLFKNGEIISGANPSVQYYREEELFRFPGIRSNIEFV